MVRPFNRRLAALIGGAILAVMAGVLAWSISLKHTVKVARGRAQAVAEVAAGYRPEVVILDMNMSEIDDRDTLLRLRETLPTVPVLPAPGRADQAVVDFVASRTAVTLMPKPFDLGQLELGILESVSSARHGSGQAAHL